MRYLLTSLDQVHKVARKIGRISVQFVVLVAKNRIVDVHRITDSDRTSRHADINQRVKSGVSCFRIVVVIENQGALYLGKTVLEVARLPRPPNTIEVGVV